MVATLLSGCAAGGVSIPEGNENLQPCQHRVIPAAELSTLGEPGCDLEGSSVTTPDGRARAIGEVGGVASTSFGDPARNNEASTLIANWGVPGVAVSLITREGTETWARTETARELQKKQLRL